MYASRSEALAPALPGGSATVAFQVVQPLNALANVLRAIASMLGPTPPAP
jgi:hypothetical protein